MDAVDTIIAVPAISKLDRWEKVNLRRHIRPRFSMLLGQHKRHEIDFAKSPSAHDTIVAMSIVFFIVRARKESQGWDGKPGDVIAHTKCLIVVPIPPFWTPFTNDAAIMPDKNGSSEKHSKL